MKRGFALLLCAALALLIPALAEGLGGLAGSLLSQAEPLPDPAEVTGEPGSLYREDYAFSQDFLCDAYVYPIPGDADGFLARYVALAEAHGYAVTETVTEGHPSYRIEDAGANLCALLLPEFEGRMLLLVNVALPFGASAAAEPAAPQAAPAEPAPTAAPAGEAPTGSGHVEYVTQQTPCYVCHTSGKCSLCNGTGVYRLYGESVPCDTVCSYCDGLGYIEQMVPVWIPD